MANTITALDSLKKNDCIRVYPGMTVVWPQLSSEENLNLSEIAPKFPNRYAMNNSTVAFVSDHEVYVTPYTRTVVSTLESSGFRSEYFYVPFSNGDYPKDENAQWVALIEKARQTRQLEFADECIAYCEKHHIRALSSETLANCFEMPRDGVHVKHHYFEDWYYPVLTSGLDTTKIGHYCTNNGRVVFIHQDGKTYVTKGYKILDELRAAGYKETGIFVPFSNGEQIVDPVQRLCWESIHK